MDSQKQKPLFSIVVPTRNRPNQVYTLLQALASLEYPKEKFEVILVDDGSEQCLDGVVAPFRSMLQVKLLRQNVGGCANARQHGVSMAQGTYLAFTDDDCLPQIHWLQIMEEHFGLEKECALTGPVQNALEGNCYSATTELLLHYIRIYSATAKGSRSFFPTNNIAFPAELFRRIGGMNPSWTVSGGEDRDLCYRWLAGGYSIRFLPDMRVLHAHHLNFQSFWRQHFHYGRGAFLYHYGYTPTGTSRIPFESADFYLRLLLFPFAQLPVQQALPVFFLLGVSQIATLTGLLYQGVVEFIRRLWGQKFYDAPEL